MEPFLVAILGNDNAIRSDAERRFTEHKKTYPRDVSAEIATSLAKFLWNILHPSYIVTTDCIDSLFSGTLTVVWGSQKLY